MSKTKPSGGAGGSIPTHPINVARVSKIMLWPSRKVNLGNYSTVDLNAGVEMVFDEPVDADSKQVKEALNEARKIIREEFKEQYKPYQKLKGGDK